MHFIDWSPKALKVMNKTVLIIRNPIFTAVSEFNRKKSKKYSVTTSHVASVKDEWFSTKGEDKFLSTSVSYIIFQLCL